MKKAWKRIVTLALALVMTVSVLPVQASAASAKAQSILQGMQSQSNVEIPSKVVLTKYKTKDLDYVGYDLASQSQYLIVLSGKISNLKSSNSKVVKVTKYRDSNNNSTSIYMYPKKKGTSTVSFKYKSKTYKIKVQVKNYTNPVSSIKVGSKTIKGSKFKNTAHYYMKYSTYKNKSMKVNIKLKSGWKLYDGMQGTKSYFTWFRNNSGFSTVKNNKTKIKVRQKWDGLFFLAQNSKTGQQEYIYITFK